MWCLDAPKTPPDPSKPHCSGCLNGPRVVDWPAMRGRTRQHAPSVRGRLAALLASAGLVASSFTLALPALGDTSPLGATHASVLAASGGDPVIAAAGDIACDPADSKFNGGAGVSNGCRQLATSNLLVNAGLAGVLALGDVQYYCGSYSAFMGSYDLSWGRVKAITYPTVGNHEYLTHGGSGPSTGCDATNTNAAGYYQYFGARAGNPSQGYYSFDIGAWHLISLNTQCSSAGGCGTTSPQGKWLAADLAAHPNQCTLAFFHIPLFSSGGRAASNANSFWQLLYAAKADVILNGHDHIYERFAPQTPTGTLDAANGIREFIIGTGGANMTSLSTIAANSEVRNSSTFGVLDLTLHATGYDWNFVPEAGKTFTDSGSGTCHATGGGGGDTQKPTVPSITSGTAVSSSRVDLAWTTSTDNVGVTGYTVYRNGSPISTTTGPSATTYSDLTVSPSTTYNYTVDAFDAANNHSNQSSVKVVTTPAVVTDTGPPSIPSITSASAPSSGRVDLVWTTSTDDVGVTGYTVYRNGSSLATTSGPTATSYSDLTVNPSTSYSYTVDAFDAAGHHSNQSAPAVVMTPAASVPVTLLPIADSYVDSSKATTNYGTSTSLRFDGSPVVQSYLMFDLTGVSGTITKATLRVYANTASAGYTVGGTATTWTETGLTAANAPTVGSSVGSSGAFGASSWTSVDVTSLVTTGKLSLAMSGINSTAVKLSSRESGTSTAPQLVIERASAPPPQPPVASFTPSLTTQTAGLPIGFTDTSTNTPTSWLWDFGDGTNSTLRNPNHTWSTAGPYTVSLVATNGVGSSVPAATVGITIAPDNAPPTAPLNLSATASGTAAINLAWGASTDNVGVTGYELYRADLVPPLAVLGPGTLTYQDTGLTPDTTYTYSVLARDAANNPSATAGPQSATTDALPPPPQPPVASFTPSLTTQTAGLPIGFTDTSTNTPTSWLWDFGDGTNSTLRNPNHTWSTAGPYTVSLVATNGVGSSVPAATVGITIAPDNAPPTAPLNLSATASGTAAINLAWGASTDNVGVTGYELYRADLVPPLAVLGPGTLTYQDTGLTPDTTYTYSVLARDAANNPSATAGPQSATTDALPPPPQPPVASFTPSLTTQTAGLPIGFTDTSTNTPTSWLWDFGDGTNSTLRNPNHTWSTAGPYTVSLVATNGVGSSVPAATVGITIAPDNAPPTAPLNLSATASGTAAINLAWGASTDNVGVTGYELYRADLVPPLAVLGPGTLTYQDTGLTPDTTYTYSVLARDAANNPSATAGPQSATTDALPPPPPSQLTLLPIADSYVDSSSPTTNYGTSTSLRFDGSPIVQSYLMFDLTGISGTITKATLRVYANTASSAGYTVGATGSTWTETGLNAGNAPAVGASVGGSGAIAAGSWTTVDVTVLVVSGKLSVVMSGINSTAVRLSSRESGATAPQLVLDFGS